MLQHYTTWQEKKVITVILITRPYIYLGIKYLQEPLCDTELCYKKYLEYYFIKNC